MSRDTATVRMLAFDAAAAAAATAAPRKVSQYVGSREHATYIHPKEAVSVNRVQGRPKVTPTSWGGYMVEYFDAADTTVPYRIEYWQDGVLHRPNGLPALVCQDGEVVAWYERGELHRGDDRPALVYTFSRQVHDWKGVLRSSEWWWRGRLHRDHDRPAVTHTFKSTCPDGTTTATLHAEWWRAGTLHRDHDRPAVLSAMDEYLVWAQDGEYHREGDRPAMIVCAPQSMNAVSVRSALVYMRRGVNHRDGHKPARMTKNELEWYVNGELSRTTGPARLSCRTVVHRRQPGEYTHKTSETLVAAFRHSGDGIFGDSGYVIEDLRRWAQEEFKGSPKEAAWRLYEMNHGWAPGVLSQKWDDGAVTMDVDLDTGEVFYTMSRYAEKRARAAAIAEAAE